MGCDTCWIFFAVSTTSSFWIMPLFGKTAVFFNTLTASDPAPVCVCASFAAWMTGNRDARYICYTIAPKQRSLYLFIVLLVCRLLNSLSLLLPSISPRLMKCMVASPTVSSCDAGFRWKRCSRRFVFVVIMFPLYRNRPFLVTYHITNMWKEVPSCRKFISSSSASVFSRVTPFSRVP